MNAPTTARAVNPMLQRRVLLVDAEAHVLRSLRAALLRNGYEVQVALDAESAIARASEVHYDVIITDLALADDERRWLCEALGRRRLDQEALTLVMSDAASDPEHEWLSRLPGVECIERPLRLGWLIARMNAHFAPKIARTY